ncbi:MAG: DUF2589 domain-containing protein [Succinivibrio sp.]
MTDIKTEFSGLPMEDLIGGPLQAACKAQANLAQTTVDFIKNVGFSNSGKENDGQPLKTNMVNFEFDKPVVDSNGVETTQKASLSVPLLSIVKTPNLSIQNVNVSFDMEVKTSSSETSKTKAESSLQGDFKSGFLVKSNVSIKGSVSTHKENTRSTDTSAKYHVELQAADTGMPEGLSRVFDILNSVIVPRIDNKSDGGNNTAPAVENASPKVSKNTRQTAEE